MMTLTSTYIHYPIVRKLERLELRQGRLESLAGGSTRREQVHAQLQRYVVESAASILIPN